MLVKRLFNYMLIALIFLFSFQSLAFSQELNICVINLRKVIDGIKEEVIGKQENYSNSFEYLEKERKFVKVLFSSYLPDVIKKIGKQKGCDYVFKRKSLVWLSPEIIKAGKELDDVVIEELKKKILEIKLEVESAR